MIPGIHGEVTTVDTGVDTIPTGVTVAHTGMDTIMDSIVASTTGAGTTIIIIIGTAGSAAGIPWDIQAGPV